jgi:hypothetical protein
MEGCVWVGNGVGEDPGRDGGKKGVRDDAYQKKVSRLYRGQTSETEMWSQSKESVEWKRVEC